MSIIVVALPRKTIIVYEDIFFSIFFLLFHAYNISDGFTIYYYKIIPCLFIELVGYKLVMKLTYLWCETYWSF